MPSAPDIVVSRWDPRAVDSHELYRVYEATLGSIDPYAQSAQKFDQLVSATRATVFIATPSDGDAVLGFALTYLIRAGSAREPTAQHDKGSLALLLVHPDHRHRGIGTLLQDTALEYLITAVRDSLSRSTPPAGSSELQLGSIFPRIFPGLPAGDEFQETKAWFEKRGWTFKKGESIDLYRETGDLGYLQKDMQRLCAKARDAGWTFGLSRDDDALMDLQMREFGRFTGWPDSFPVLLDAGRREDVWCAYDPAGMIQGATVAAMPGGPIHENQAWPDTIGSACGVIACVGVSSASQGSGAGIALVATALDHLAQLGADGCFVDWVTLKGFYEKAGFRKWARGYWESWREVKAAP